MKKNHIIFHFLYYTLTIAVYMAFFCSASLVLKKHDDLGSVIAVTYGVLFVMTPILVTVLMRFSLFRWYVDPIAAAEIPLFLYVGMLLNQIKRSGDLISAFHLVNNDLGDDGGMGWLFLAGLFVFGLLMSFSPARKNGQSISYRLLSYHSTNSDSDCADHLTTYWKFDFPSLPRWDIRNTIPFVYDKFYSLPQSDMLCCIYSIAEVRMGWYVGSLAILKNKESPELVLNISDGLDFCDNFSANKSGNMLFLQPSIYDKESTKVRCPILIIDLSHKKFALFETNNYNPCYKVVEISDTLFGIEADEKQRKTDERLNSLAERKIDSGRLEWRDLSELNTANTKI